METSSKEEHRKAIYGWTMYDWANSAFITSVMASVFPLYFAMIAKPTLGDNTSAAWGYTTSIALFITAVLSPILGAMADFQGKKKRFLTYFMSLGVISTALMYFIITDRWLLASILFICGNVGFAGANVFYDSLLPHVANDDEIDQVSTRGYAIGYLGGGILLAINFAMILGGPKFLASMAMFSTYTEADITALMIRITFVTVAMWWLGFTIPLWKHVSEPPRHVLAGEEGQNPVHAGFARLKSTFKEITKYRELLKFLIAFWLYNDGIGTIIKMATIYGDEIGIGQADLLGAMLMVAFLGIPFTFAFGWLAKRIGTKTSIYITLVVYTITAIAGYFMQTALHFWLLSVAVTMVQGGSLALSRSLFSRMVPKSKSAEFFGFFSVSSKFAGIAGPFVFAIISQATGGSRLSIVSLIFFFITGLIALTFVDENKGAQIAKAEETKLALSS